MAHLGTDHAASPSAPLLPVEERGEYFAPHSAGGAGVARRDLLGLLPEELAAELRALGEPPYRARQLFRWLHRRCEPDFERMSDLPRALRARLAATYARANSAEVVRTLRSADGGTTKLLLRYADGQDVEAVEMAAWEDDGDLRRTVCVSTQAGCAVGCVFCVTGQFGFSRNLTAGEIVEQVYHFARGGRTATNVVFMGMGEPLANYAATVRAIRLLNHPLGHHLSARRITVSTAGVVPGILRLAEERLPVTLAVSLHAPNDDLRSALVPLNRRWPIAELLDAARHYFARTGRRVSFEYTMIRDVNDAPALARELVALLRGLTAHVNLIPMNPSEDQTLESSPPERIAEFAAIVRAAGIPCTVRVNRGRDILAACGQLRLAERRRPTGRAT